MPGRNGLPKAGSKRRARERRAAQTGQPLNRRCAGRQRQPPRELCFFRRGPGSQGDATTVLLLTPTATTCARHSDQGFYRERLYEAMSFSSRDRANCSPLSVSSSHAADIHFAGSS